jgi:cystathionine beta-synthase
MRSYGFLDQAADVHVADLLASRVTSLPTVVHVHPDETVRDAIRVMREFGVSQLPVITAEPPVTTGEVVGSVTDSQLLDLVYADGSAGGRRVAEHMAPPLPWIGSGEGIDVARRALAASGALMVVQDGSPIGVLTSQDLLDHLAGDGRGYEMRAGLPGATSSTR